MDMVVTCESCGARFLMKQALFQDAKGARIRCRKCGGHIDAWNPGTSPTPPAPEAPAPVVPPRPEPVPSPRHEQAIPPVPAGIEAEPEIAPAASPEPATAPELERAAEAAPEPVAEADIELVAEPEPEPVAEARLPAEAGSPAEAQADVPAFNLLDAVPAAAPEPGSSREEREAELAALKRQFRGSRRRGPSMLAIFLLVVLCILLLAGGAFFFRDTKPVQELLGKFRDTKPARELLRGFFPPPGPAKTASPASPASAVEKPAYDIRDMDASHMKAYDGTNLFVIRGTVANVGKGPSRGIRVHAALLGRDNQALVNKTVFPGNVVDNTALRHGGRALIDGMLGYRYGEGNANREIPPGNSLPFMAVFFDPPGQFESYTVKALDAE